MSNPRRSILLLAVLLFAVANVNGQQPAASPSPSPTPPSNNIFLVSISSNRDSLKLGQPTKITDWNGYNNQPFFLPDNQSLLYTSIRADKQADIYRYDIASRVTTRITATAESEYSPTLTPDGNYISVVRVEADGTQRLWKFPLGKGEPALVLAAIKPVGYHTWIDGNTVAVYVLGQPNSLQIADVATGSTRIVGQNIGRTLRLIPKQNDLSFVQRVSDQEWLIKSLDLKTFETKALIKTLAGSEDYAWMPSGVLLMTSDARIFKWDPKSDRAWVEVADFANAGLKSLTRIAVSPNGQTLALVGH